MPCQWCLYATATNIVIAWFVIVGLKKGDFQDVKLIFALTVYTTLAYVIVWGEYYPVLLNSTSQLILSAVFLWKAVRVTGNFTGIIFMLMGFLGATSIFDSLDNTLWQGPYANNYWNYSAWSSNICVFLSWVLAGGRDIFKWSAR